MGFRSAVRTLTWVFALQGALDTSILTALVKGIPQGRRRLDRDPLSFSLLRPEKGSAKGTYDIA